ncbi:MAG: hypothetical protein ISR65_20650 [Bacteriovoracaceae bacterium]|nr:hypothetical protein [Bacteriovoracaceae bacterium]
MSYKKGDIVVVKFPFILKELAERQKGRPALVVFDDKVERKRGGCKYGKDSY